MRPVPRTLSPAVFVGSVLAALLTGCGGAGVPGTEGPGDPVPEPTVVALVSGSAAGGRVSPEAVRVEDPAALADFAARFDGHLGERVVAAAETADVPEGHVLFAAVVDLGCEPPDDVRVTEAADGARVTAVTEKPSGIQCLVPITTVALVTAAG